MNTIDVISLDELDRRKRSEGRGALDGDHFPPSKLSGGRDFRWLSFANVTGPVLNGNWIIKSVLPRYGSGVFYGKPGSGKSAVVLDLALHVAAGRAWRGLKTAQLGVTYIASEAGPMGINRVLAWSAQHGLTWPENFRMSPVTLDLCSTQVDAQALANDIRYNQLNCGLIIVDTLNRNMAGGNENAPEDRRLVSKLLTHFTRRSSSWGLNREPHGQIAFTSSLIGLPTSTSFARTTYLLGCCL